MALDLIVVDRSGTRPIGIAAADRLCGDIRFGLGRFIDPAVDRWRGAFMKSLITLFVLGLFSAAMVGCEANAGARVGDPDDTTVQKKTTTTYDDGDRTVKTKTTIEKD
jgi:hypothetical protein